MDIPKAEIDEIVRRALLEDLGGGDMTTDALVPPSLQGKGVIVAKADGILAGIEVADAVFHMVDPSLRFERILADGARLRRADPDRGLCKIAEISGSAASILKAERVALNFLEHMSGVASATHRFVQQVADLNVTILDTRKTLPGHRILQKYAVTVGGGVNHRRDLSDGALIKDNHIAAGSMREMGIGALVRAMRDALFGEEQIEVEAETLDQVREAVESGADIVMLDNMSIADMTTAVEIVDGRAATEASGGVTLENVREVAETGVDRISIGALTHSVMSVDISLEFTASASARPHPR